MAKSRAIEHVFGEATSGATRGPWTTDDIRPGRSVAVARQGLFAFDAVSQTQAREEAGRPTSYKDAVGSPD